MEDIWKIYGRYIGNIWKIYGKYMENIWKIYGRYIENIWKIYGGYMEDACRECMENMTLSQNLLPVDYIIYITILVTRAS